ncbi:MAG: DUF2029 domain-containing protein [Solirubrobacterales bacterium]|nr:DUF2029 domain-containing protein [Solirubrobacterales bacterium]
MGDIQLTTPIPRTRDKGTARAASGGERAHLRPAVARTLGATGMLGVLATLFLISAGAASAPSQYVPARVGGWPGWLAGPLAGLHVGLGSSSFQVLMLIMCASYLLVLGGARELALAPLAGAIVLAHVILVLGPPLISQDVFGYLAFARMGALHGLDPYTHVAAEASRDPVFAFVGWPFKHSPYGPLFTLASYLTAPLGPAGGLWLLKILAAAASLGALALIARAARGLGHSATTAAAFVGLNPVMLVLAVGGAHNDTLLLLSLAGALALTAVSPRPRAASAALVAGVGVKLSAGIVLPFLVLSAPRVRERLAILAAALLSLLALALLGVLGFGVHALGFLGALGEQQQLVATHSIPAETARLFSLSGTPAWWRHLFAAGFLVALAATLWRTARGSDWRVCAGWATVALLASTAWLLPWYAIWLLPLAAVSGDRRLRTATLLICAYAILIHLPLADGLLSPGRQRSVTHLHLAVPGLRHRMEFASFEILHDVHVDLRW